MYDGFVQNASLLPHTSYHIGGKAKFLARVTDADELLRAMELCEKRLVLGRGSKVLVSDEGFDGVVILMRFLGIKHCAKSKSVYAEAGVSLPVLSRFFANKGLKGLEWACGIPAGVGGALKLNAGAYGGDISRIINYADVLRDGKKIRLSKEECAFTYRGSGFYPDDVILGAEFNAEKGDEAEISRLRALCGEKRVAAQPAGFSCGSVFKAAEKPAYTYIQDCGLKGLSIGDAVVSEKHGNFILNRGFAKARDVYNLIRTVKAEVFAKHRVRLSEEVIYIGNF